MDYILLNSLIMTNLILAYIIRELWKNNKKKDEVIELQERFIKTLNK
jgi:hypothetical protein